MNTQKCKGCEEDKPLEEFGVDRRNKRGKKYRCKKCVSSQMAEYYQRNRSKIKEYAKKYYLENKEEGSK